MARIDGGEMLVRVLEQAGVRTIFTLHGGHLDAFFQAAVSRDLRLIDTRHEQAAGHAADGWARTTGETGVAIVTAGPGFTDCVTAIANAYLDCIPTLFIAGAAPLRDAETLPLQGGIDQVAIVAPITKWAHRVTHTRRIPDLVAQALRIARSGRPGPVFLEIPIDVLFSRVGEEKVAFPKAIMPDAAPAPGPEAVRQAVEWLRAAERPAILVGGGAWFSGAGSELIAFSERTNTPVFSNGKAHGLVPADHRLCGRGFANLGIAARMMSVEADLVLVLGARFGLFTGGRSGVVPEAARVIQIDVEPEEIGRNRDVDLGIAADCREALRALAAEASGQSWPERSAWLEAITAVRDGHRAFFAEALERDKAPIHPYRLASEIVGALPRDAIIAADGGETSAWMETASEVHGGGHWMSHGYLGCLGTGMPFAIAAKVAHPERPVVCVIGDGSVGLNFSEFDTMVRHKLPIVTVINNDQQWGMSAHGQDLIYGEGKRVVTDLSPTRYEQAAAGFGCHAEQVIAPEDLRPALERALASGRPACVNVMTDGSVIAPITLAMTKGLGGDGKDEGVAVPYYAKLEE
jgi:acetolactate synthase-1/2/3 large subunit